jgi:hypothetical protein
VKASKGKIAIAASCMAILAPLLAVFSATAQAQPRPAVILSASVGRLPAGSALVIIQVGLPYGASASNHYVPAGFHYPAVADQTVKTGAFSIGVPDSATLRRAASLGHGIAEFNVLVYSGSRFTSQMIPVTLSSSAANGNIQALAQAQGRQVSMHRFRAFSPMPAAMRRAFSSVRASNLRRLGCGPIALGSPEEDLTRIGEIHVGGDVGLSMRWKYDTTADTTLSVGGSTASETGPWSYDGTFTATNSIGSSGGFTAGRDTLIYSDGDMWYQRYEWVGGMCTVGYTNQVVSAVGDSTEGSNSPGANPYGGCSPGVDPLGYARLNPNKGSFDDDRATAKAYSADATVFGYTFGGSTGFTNTIHHDYSYDNPSSSSDIFVCGGDSGMMPNSKVIYSGSF